MIHRLSLAIIRPRIRSLSLSPKYYEKKPPQNDEIQKSGKSGELTDGHDGPVKLGDIVKKKDFYSRAEVEQLIVESEERRKLETPGEKKARLRREMEPIFAEVADMDQIKYEIAEVKHERAATYIMRFGLIGALLLGVAGYLFVVLQRKKLAKEHTATKRQTFGKACLEGNFELVETATGDRFSSTDLLGKWGLVYFGFTRCPDVCPEQLEKLAYVIEGVETQRKKQPELEELEALFISIDTKRDTFEQINEYCADFHPKLKGLSGTESAVDHAAKSFRIYFSKGIVDDDDENYLMDHSIVIFLVNPEGKIEEYFTQYKSPGEVIFSTIERMKMWRVGADLGETMRRIEARKEAKRLARGDK